MSAPPCNARGFLCNRLYIRLLRDSHVHNHSFLSTKLVSGLSLSLSHARYVRCYQRLSLWKENTSKYRPAVTGFEAIGNGARSDTWLREARQKCS